MSFLDFVSVPSYMYAIYFGLPLLPPEQFGSLSSLLPLSSFPSQAHESSYQSHQFVQSGQRSPLSKQIYSVSFKIFSYIKNRNEYRHLR